MRAALLSLSRWSGAADLVARYGYGRLALVVVPHIIAFAIMVATEVRLVEIAAFLLAWGILNFFWLALTRRPAVAGALSLVLMTVLVLLSDLKYHVLMMTANFVDLMIIDTDTVSFLFTIYPALRWIVALCLFALVPLVVFTWRADPFRVRRLTAAAAALACVAAITAIETHLPLQPFEAFYGGNQVSSFARSGVDAISELLTHGLMESDAVAAERLQPAGKEAAAHYSHPRRIEFRHPHGAGHQGAGRLRRAFQIVRRQGAQFPGRRQWRAELVHRIQCAGRPLGAHLRPLLVLRYPHCRGPCRARPAGGAAALRLSHVFALSGARRLHEREELPDHHRRAAFLRPARSGDERYRARQFLLRRRDADDRQGT